MWALRLPELGGTRDAARLAVEAQLSDEPIAKGDRAVVIARDLLSSSASFADEIVRCLLGVSGAAEIILVAPPKKFETQVREAATRRGFDGCVSRESAAVLGV